MIPLATSSLRPCDGPSSDAPSSPGRALLWPGLGEFGEHRHACDAPYDANTHDAPTDRSVPPLRHGVESRRPSHLHAVERRRNQQREHHPSRWHRQHRRKRPCDPLQVPNVRRPKGAPCTRQLVPPINAYCGSSVPYLRNLVSAGQIPVYGRPRVRRFRRDMLDLFLTDPDAAMRQFRAERNAHGG